MWKINYLYFFIVLSEIVSICFLYKIWIGKDFFILKLLLSLATLIPIIGPIFYFFGSDTVPRSQNNLNASGRLFGRGAYTEWWSNEKPRMEEKIRKLEKEINEKNNQ